MTTKRTPVRPRTPKAVAKKNAPAVERTEENNLPITDRALRSRLRKLQEIKAQEKDLAAIASSIQAEILEIMTAREETTHQFDNVSATVVQSVTTTLDESKLKSSLGAQLWTKVTTRALDKKKLDSLVKSGDIKALTVARATTQTPRAPYVKITVS